MEVNADSPADSSADDRAGSSADEPADSAADEPAPISLLEGLATTRAIRRYRPDPIPDEDLATILWHAGRAPSGSNRQKFRFLVLRDGPHARQAKALLGEAFRAGWQQKATADPARYVASNGGAAAGEADSDGAAAAAGATTDAAAADSAAESAAANSSKARMARTMQHFVDNFEQTPVVVLACLVRYRPANYAEGASIYPAVQNLLLAARALGYGGVITGWHAAVEPELRELLKIPAQVAIHAVIPLGRPVGKHGPVRRHPLSEMVYDDYWDNPAAWATEPT